MAQETGIRVRLQDPDGWVDFPDATSTTVAAGGNLAILRARPRGFPEALAEIPRDRWRSWTPVTESE